MIYRAGQVGAIEKKDRDDLEERFAATIRRLGGTPQPASPSAQSPGEPVEEVGVSREALRS